MTTGGTLIFNNNANVEEIDIVNLDIHEEKENESIVEEENINNEDDHEEENDLIDTNDFAIIFKFGTNDVNIVVPDIQNFEELNEQEKQSFSQNQFLIGFINYALNNEDWLNEYSFSLQNKHEDFLGKFMDMMSHMQNLNEEVSGEENEISMDLLKKIMGLTEHFQNIEKLSDDVSDEEKNDEKDIDFTSAVEQLNKNKPKIIT